jgi:hypothetical protein
MQNIQEIFNKIQDLKKNRKEIGREYRDSLSQSAGYQDLQEEIKKLREKKKMLEAGVQSEMGLRYEELEKAAQEIQSLSQMLTDIALSTLMKGESINLKDQYNTEYEPAYKITFKKTNPVYGKS